MKPLSIYIHVPFCRQKCRYCDFYSLESSEYMNAYLKALYQSIEHHAKNLADNYTVQTLYLGGGTPNLLSPAQLEGVLNIVSRHYTFTEHPEITIEINPEFSSDRKSLKTLSEIGFTRLSIGIQSLNDAELAILGRIHSR
ncbi:MAG: radical SAM protein, partial [Candidatus Marinimicrobia bacterium]|nr:radical SAM protein [Candidatus Neomarinimicrobiota bacterium]